MIVVRMMYVVVARNTSKQAIVHLRRHYIVDLRHWFGGYQIVGQMTTSSILAGDGIHCIYSIAYIYIYEVSLETACRRLMYSHPNCDHKYLITRNGTIPVSVLLAVALSGVNEQYIGDCKDVIIMKKHYLTGFPFNNKNANVYTDYSKYYHIIISKKNTP